MRDLAALAGRLLMAVLFLSSAFGKITDFEATVRFMEAHGMNWAPFFCSLAAGLESAGGMSLLLGYGTRWAAAALAAYLLAVTTVFHIGAEQRVDLLKNLAILGGLLMALAFGPGDMSLEARGRPR